MNRDTLPPGGWKFYQPETQWMMPEPMSQSFRTAVERIVQHRLANPALAATANAEQAEADLEAYTLSRIQKPGEPGSTPKGSAQTGGCGACGRR